MAENEPPVRPPPSAAEAGTDAESGTVGGDDRDQALFALDAMLGRGLIDQATYDRRRAAILANDPDPPRDPSRS
ncbi:MAG: hypothetical protein ACTS3R_21235 [Inquilinaceae bacterium]